MKYNIKENRYLLVKCAIFQFHFILFEKPHTLSHLLPHSAQTYALKCFPIRMSSHRNHWTYIVCWPTCSLEWWEGGLVWCPSRGCCKECRGWCRRCSPAASSSGPGTPDLGTGHFFEILSLGSVCVTFDEILIKIRSKGEIFVS